MLDQSEILAAARRIAAAEKSRKQIRHISLDHPGMTMDDAYAIQRAWIDIKLGEGRTIQGRKIGLTSRAMQQAAQITEPDHGVLLDDMFFAEGSDIPCDRFIEPRVEVEIAFILAKSLAGPGVTVFDVLQATDYVTPAAEILDSRLFRNDPDTGAPRKILDTISDNAADAGIVLGGRPVKPDAIDLRWVSALLYQNGVIEESGVAAAVLNHPAKGIAWLANKLAPRGVTLEAGQVVLAGSFTRPVFAKRGDTFHLDYRDLGAVTFRFV